MDRPVVKHPRTIGEALRMVQEPGACFYAGGIELHLWARRDPGSSPPVWVSLAGLRELCGVRPEGTELVLGAGSTYSQVLESRPDRLPPMLREALGWVGCEAIRNQGTLGGAVAAGAPFLDLLPPLVALEARLHLLREGEDPETIPVADYLLMAPDRRRTRLITGIRIPGWTGGGDCRCAYQRYTLRTAMDPPRLSLAVVLGIGGEGRIRQARLVLGGHRVSGIRRMEQAEALLEGSDPVDGWPPQMAAVLAGEAELRDPDGCGMGVVQWLLEGVQTRIQKEPGGGGGTR